MYLLKSKMQRSGTSSVAGPPQTSGFRVARRVQCDPNGQVISSVYLDDGELSLDEMRNESMSESEEPGGRTLEQKIAQWSLRYESRTTSLGAKRVVCKIIKHLVKGNLHLVDMVKDAE